MGVGKYSPTVSMAYQKSQEWWENNGGGADKPQAPDMTFYDNDGYDSYGYNPQNIDRAGHEENDYLQGEYLDDDTYVYSLYESVLSDWGINDKGLPQDLTLLPKKLKI